jgi:hypothetical protein
MPRRESRKTRPGGQRRFLGVSSIEARQRGDEHLLIHVVDIRVISPRQAKQHTPRISRGQQGGTGLSPPKDRRPTQNQELDATIGTRFRPIRFTEPEDATQRLAPAGSCSA